MAGSTRPYDFPGIEAVGLTNHFRVHKISYRRAHGGWSDLLRFEFVCRNRIATIRIIADDE